MAPLTSIWEAPETPAVYALYGRAGGSERAVFVGFARSLLERLLEQLVVPSVGMRAASATLFMEPGYLSGVRWWEHDRFADADALRAAEFVAADTLVPLLSSRRPSSPGASALYDDDAFRRRMRELFLGPPSGIVVLPTLADLVERLERLEQRLLESR